MKKIVLFPARQPAEKVLRTIGTFTHIKITGVLQKSRERAPDWNQEKTGLPTWTLDEISSTYISHDLKPDLEMYDQCLENILCDPRSFYLADRKYGINNGNNSFKNTVHVEAAVWNSLSIFKSTSTDWVIMHNTPHELSSWIFSRVAEILNLPVYFFKSSPLVWRSWIVKGPDEQQIIRPYSDTQNKIYRNNEAGHIISHTTAKFIESKKRFCECDGARNQLINIGLSESHAKIDRYHVFKHQDLKISFKKMIIAAKKIFLSGYFRNKSLFKKYQEKTKSFQMPERFGSFLIQYQPERSSLPEGYLFSQQLLAIRKLSENLPEGIRLVVKEHPHMKSSLNLTSNQSGVRSDSFYEAIASMHNVDLAPIETDSIQLIEKGLFVSTLTGKIGIEAILRNKPVLAFGAASYRNNALVYNVSKSIEIQNAISEIIGLSGSINNNIEEYFAWVESLTIERKGCGLERVINGGGTSFSNDTEHYIELLGNLLSNTSEPQGISPMIIGKTKM